MRNLWHGIVGALLWTYERGSWPYDVMVLAIVLFVLATPRSWFHDAPMAVSARAHCVLSGTASANSRTTAYRLDAACVPAPDRAAVPSPKLEKDVHDVLGRSAPELAGRTFQVQSIQARTDASGGVQSYDVTVRPVNIP